MCSGQIERVSSVLQLLILKTAPLQKYSGLSLCETSLENYLFDFIIGNILFTEMKIINTLCLRISSPNIVFVIYSLTGLVMVTIL